MKWCRANWQARRRRSKRRGNWRKATMKLSALTGRTKRPCQCSRSRRGSSSGLPPAKPSLQREGVIRSFFLRHDQFAIDEHLGDLNRVERRALAKIVGDAPKRETVLDRRILTDARNIGRVLARRLMRRD